MKRKANFYPSKGDFRTDAIDTRGYATGRPSNFENGTKFVQGQNAPFAVSGVRVPDMCTYPTQTQTLRMEITQKVASNGTCGGSLLLDSCGIYYGPEIGGDALSSAGLTVDSAASNYSTDDQILNYGPYTGGYTAGGMSPNLWNLPTTTSTLTNNDGNTLLNGYNTLNTEYSAVRIVSAGLDVQFLGDDSSNKGLIVGCFQTKNDLQYRVDRGLKTTAIVPNSTSTWDWNTTVNKRRQMGLATLKEIVNYRDSYQGRADKGVYLTASAVDNRDYELGRTFALDITNTFGLTRFTGSDEQRQSLGNLQWHATGCNSTASFRIFIVVHVEGLLASDTLTLGELAVCVDPNAQLQSLFQRPSRCASSDRVREEQKANLQTAGSQIVSNSNGLSQTKITEYFAALGAGVDAGTIQTLADVQNLARQVLGVVSSIKNLQKNMYFT